MHKLFHSFTLHLSLCFYWHTYSLIFVQISDFSTANLVATRRTKYILNDTMHHTARQEKRVEKVAEREPRVSSNGIRVNLIS